jgi:hypothetical protein
MTRHAPAFSLVMARVRAVFAALLLGTLGVLTAAPAAATPQEGAYIVSDVRVDATGATGAEAQSRGFAQARVRATELLLQRLTLGEDRASPRFPTVDAALAGRLAAAIDVQEERRSAGRYLATLRVVFDPSAVRRLLRDAEVPFTDAVAPLALVAPVATGEAAADLPAFRAAWPARGEGLVPFGLARAPLTANSGWPDAAPEARALGAQRLVLATLIRSAGRYRVELTEVFADGGRATLGSTVEVGSSAEAARQAVTFMDESWKRGAIVRGGPRTELTATALFASQVEWNGLRTALLRAASVSGVRVDAVSTGGAVVTLSYTGARERLEVDLRRLGVLVEIRDIGVVLRPGGAGGG